MYGLTCETWMTLSKRLNDGGTGTAKWRGGIKASHSHLRILTHGPFARINYSPTSAHPKPRTHPSLPLSTQRMTSSKTPAQTSAWSERTKDSERLMIPHKERETWADEGCILIPLGSHTNAWGRRHSRTPCPISFQFTEEQAKTAAVTIEEELFIKMRVTW